jgi:DNA replication protein DnaC
MATESIENVTVEVSAQVNATPPAAESPIFNRPRRHPPRDYLVEYIASEYSHQGQEYVGDGKYVDIPGYQRKTLAELVAVSARRYDDWKSITAEDLAKLLTEVEEGIEQLRWGGIRSALAKLDERIGPRYRGVTIDGYKVEHPGQKEIVEAIRDYGQNISARIEAGVGIVLNGPSGGGKDHLLVALARHAIRAGATVNWQNGQTLLGTFRDRFSQRHPRPEEDLIDEFTAANVLVLSDPVPPKGELSDYSESILYRIVDARYITMKPTWTTMNVASGEEADRRLGAPIVDRLRHGALCLSCDWPSYRTAGTWAKKDPE